MFYALAATATADWSIREEDTVAQPPTSKNKTGGLPCCERDDHYAVPVKDLDHMYGG